MQSFIRVAFPSDWRNEFGEISLWSNVFDFENAAVRIYPAWWSPGTLNDATKGPDTIDNASWARLFLPVRIGYEQTALRWIYGHTTETASAAIESAIKTLVNDIREYRTAFLGGVAEVAIGQADGSECPAVDHPFQCLGTWNELLPTDGTHIEVVQGSTTAMDEVSEQAINDAHRMTVAQEALRGAQANATDAAGARADVKVALNIGDSESR
jgi:hypothetical protein